MHNLIIDPEFRDLIPPLSAEEREKLEEGILDDGCRDPITVWGNTIIDGHNRYSICTKHDIYFNINYIDFEDRDEAIEWILRNQLGRRNLNDMCRVEIATRYQDVIAKRMRERMLNGAIKGGKSYSPAKGSLASNEATLSKPMTTNGELAKIAGVSKSTVERAKVILKNGTPEQIERARKSKHGERNNSISAICREVKSQMKQDSTPETVYQEPDFGESSDITETQAEKSPEEPEVKQCKVCGRILPLSSFSKIDGYYRNECKDCHKLTKAEKEGSPYTLADVHIIAQQMQNADAVSGGYTVEEAVQEFIVNAEEDIRILGQIIQMHKDVLCGNETAKELMSVAIDKAIEKMNGLKEML